MCRRPLPSLCSSSARCGLPSRRNLAREPPFERGVLGGERRVRRPIPAAIEVHAAQVEPRPAARDAILVRHRQHADAVDAQETRRLFVAREQTLDQPVRDPAAAGLPRMRARTDEDAMRRRGIADAHDLELASADGPPDRLDLHETM